MWPRKGMARKLNRTLSNPPLGLKVWPADQRRKAAAGGQKRLRHERHFVASRISGLPSSRFDFDPKRMLLDLGYRQDFVLLLFGDLKGIGARDALTFRMDGQGQGQSI